MVLKKEEKELKIINDINRLSLDDLREKYLRNESTYNQFVDDFSNLFRERLTYQLRVADKFETIYKLCKDGLEKYPSEIGINKTAELVDTMAYVTHNYSLIDQSKEDYHQAHAIFRDVVGADKTKHYNHSYESLVNAISESCTDYSNKKDDFSFDEYMQFISDTIDKYDNPTDIKREVDIYKEANRLAGKTNDIKFLYFVNYMLKHRKSLVDMSLIKDAQDVIRMSKITRGIDGLTPDMQEDYNRVSRYTLKNIKQFNKKVKKEETKEKALQKAKINHTFNKRHI